MKQLFSLYFRICRPLSGGLQMRYGGPRPVSMGALETSKKQGGKEARGEGGEEGGGGGGGGGEGMREEG